MEPGCQSKPFSAVCSLVTQEPTDSVGSFVAGNACPYCAIRAAKRKRLHEPRESSRLMKKTRT